MNLKKNFFSVKKRIAIAAKKSERNAEEVKLVTVSKQRSVEEIKELQALGQMDFGENKISELLEKAPELTGVCWHFVGNLQSNKARKTVEVCDFIHSVDSQKLLRKINFTAQEIGKIQNIFLEVNVSEEKTKHGFTPKEVAEVMDLLKQLPFENVRVVGLMSMAPLVEAEKTRTIFRTLSSLAQNLHLKELSMGMSNDFEVAISEGATFVRVGTAVFER